MAPPKTMSTSGARGFSCARSATPASTYRTTMPRCWSTPARLPRSSNATCRMTNACRIALPLSLFHQACPGKALEAPLPLEQAQLLCEGDEARIVDPCQVCLVRASTVADHRVGGGKTDVLQHRLPDVQLPIC